MNRKKGFTLIELLVVISIIGLLASIVLASLQAARVKGRDSRRVQDLVQLRNALILYYDQNGYYPPEVPGSQGDTSAGAPAINNITDCGASTDWVAGGLKLVSPTYISTVSKDPINTTGNTGNCYHYEPAAKGNPSSGNPVNACLWTKLESSGKWVGITVGDPLPSTDQEYAGTWPYGYQCGTDLNQVLGGDTSH